MKKTKKIKKEERIKSSYISRKSWGFFAPGIILNTMFGWYPLLAGFIVAFTSYHVIFGMRYIGLANFYAVIRDPLTVITFKNVLYYTILQLTLVFLVPIIVAILLMEMKKSIIRIMMILWFIPTASMAGIIILKWFYNPYYGLFNGVLSSLGLPTSRWLTSPRIAMLCLVIPGLIFYGPGLIYIASIQSIPEELYEAAEIEGAGFWTKIWHITLPRLRPIISVMLLLSVIGNMQVFDTPMVLTGGGPNNATNMPVLFFYRLAFEKLQFGKGQAVAVVLFSVIMVLVIVQRKYFKENLDV